MDQRLDNQHDWITIWSCGTESGFVIQLRGNESWQGSSLITDAGLAIPCTFRTGLMKFPHGLIIDDRRWHAKITMNMPSNPRPISKTSPRKKPSGKKNLGTWARHYAAHRQPQSELMLAASWLSCSLGYDAWDALFLRCNGFWIQQCYNANSGARYYVTSVLVSCPWSSHPPNHVTGPRADGGTLSTYECNVCFRHKLADEQKPWTHIGKASQGLFPQSYHTNARVIHLDKASGNLWVHRHQSSGASSGYSIRQDMLE